MPERTFILLTDVWQKLLVVRDRELINGTLTPEARLIGVCIQQGHTTALGNPIQFSFPNIDVRLSKDNKLASRQAPIDRFLIWERRCHSRSL